MNNQKEVSLMRKAVKYPEFVNIDGKKVKWEDLPIDDQMAIARSIDGIAHPVDNVSIVEIPEMKEKQAPPANMRSVFLSITSSFGARVCTSFDMLMNNFDRTVYSALRGYTDQLPMINFNWRITNLSVTFDLVNYTDQGEFFIAKDDIDRIATAALYQIDNQLYNTVESFRNALYHEDPKNASLVQRISNFYGVYRTEIRPQFEELLTDVLLGTYHQAMIALSELKRANVDVKEVFNGQPMRFF